MKDKLVKTNHGPFHYCLKKYSRNLGLFIIGAGLVAVPVTIAAQFSFEEPTAELNTSTNEVVDTQIEDSELLTY